MRPQSDLSFRTVITVRPAVVSGERCRVSSIEESTRRSLPFLSRYTHTNDSNKIDSQIEGEDKKDQVSRLIAAVAMQRSGEAAHLGVETELKQEVDVRTMRFT